MKSPFHHIRNPQGLFDHFHQNLHHAFAIFVLAIIGMLWGALHIITPTSATRLPGGFLTSDFWEQNPSPSDANITYALFGDGSPSNTAYTRGWVNSSCIPSTVTPLYATGFFGGTLTDNTIYVLNSGNYTLFNPIIMNGDCSALIGRGDVIINGNGKNIIANNRDKIILDNITFVGNGLGGGITGIIMNNISHAVLNNIDISNNNVGIASTSGNMFVLNSRIYGNNAGIYGWDAVSTTTGLFLALNNVLTYNNNVGISTIALFGYNSQIYNNNIGGIIYVGLINNSVFYNNNFGLSSSATTTNDASFYNNNYGFVGMSLIRYYGRLKFFGNNTNSDIFVVLSGGTTPPINIWTPGYIDTGATTIDYDRMTNAQNNNGEWLLNGTNRTGLRNIQSFDTTQRPIRYIFGGHIPKQTSLITSYDGGITYSTYGTDGQDFISTRYIAEPESSLPYTQQTIVNQYFASGSMYTQNRWTNGCSLSAFQVEILDPNTFVSTYNFQDHTIYILTGGEYRAIGSSTGFVFNGNCIALIGNDDTRFTKSSSVQNMFYANNKRNLVIDNIKIDGKYYATNSSSSPAQTAIRFEGTTNNSTLNAVQTYNNLSYGIYLGQGSHNNTLMNTQSFNNGSAGIHLYYSSNYNVINNTQTYNNSGYGIRFANGSKRNIMNNLQSYNNNIGIFGDLTTQENVLNRAAIYNNRNAGIYLKNSSNNMLNDVMIYNNAIGIRTLYSSPGNTYHGNLTFFDNWSGDLDGTNGDDGFLFSDSNLFPNYGTIITGDTMMSCSYATNPTFASNAHTLMTGNCTTPGYTASFVSGYNTHINYAFGLDMYKQAIPYRYDSGNIFTDIPSQYDDSKYIAEAFAIRDITPEGMNFISSGSAELNTRYTTNIYTAGVINTTVTGTLMFNPITTSGYLSINGTNVGMTGTIHNGDTVEISLHTPARYTTTITGTVTIGTVTTGFTVTTRGPNQLPTTGSLSFDSFTGLLLNIFTGSAKQVAGLETGVLASIVFDPITTSGRLEIYSGNTLINSGTTGLLVYNGNKIKAIGQTSSGHLQTVTGNVTIGLGTGMFTLTTRDVFNQMPTTGSLNFLSFTSMLFNIFTGSTTTIAGLETGVFASIAFTPITTSGRLEIYSGGTLLTSGTTGLLVYNGNQVKVIGQSSSGFSQTVTGLVTIGRGTGMFTIKTKGSDITPPTTPALTYPLSGEELFFITFEWSGSVDTGSGIEGYAYEIAEDTSFTDIVNTGFIATSTGTMGSPTTDFDATSDTFYWRIKAQDRDGNLSPRSTTGRFEAVDFNDRNFSDKDNANLDTYYDSEEITLDGIKPGLSLWATVNNNGTLYEDNNDKGTGTLVQNDDIIHLSLQSDDNFDSTRSSVLTIANRTLEFNVTTKQEGDDECTLSNADEETIQEIFDSLVQNYSGDADRYDQFLLTMQSMLEDQIDFTNDCNLQYLQDLISSELGNTPNLTGSVNTGTHIAPNCKSYTVNFDAGRMAYTSPTFRVITYFANRDSLARYIDSKNPGDCHINTYSVSSWIFSNTDPAKHIAPNGKLYLIQFNGQGYTSSDFSTVRSFSTIDALRRYIDSKNIPLEIRSHEVDTSFTPQVYTAPNGKEYTIYKTNRGYMSYKLMRVRYYSSLTELQSFIRANNLR